ncbi:hypothetical protein H0H92_001222 [Tricholoma furcatifolium]|nr:hypothetical protein H0H92_001222 [Tricholoma furcatifolium]
MTYKYELVLKLATKSGNFLATNQYTLCIQRLLSQNGDKPTTNVLAQTIAPDDINGKATTDILAIPNLDNESCFELTTWTKYAIQINTPFVQKNSFGFEPGKAIEEGATLIVYTEKIDVQGTAEVPNVSDVAPPVPKPIPFWSSPYLYGPMTQNNLTPVERLHIYFTQDQSVPGTISSEGIGYALDVNFTEVNKQTWLLKDDFTWEQET